MRNGCGFLISGMLVLAAGTMPASAQDDSSTKRYYEQLRRRGFYQLAENQAEFRLSDPLLSVERRTELVIEFSRTLVAHALSAGEDQQAELWAKAAAVLAEEIAVVESVPQRLLMQTYAALVPSARVAHFAWDLEAAPFEEPNRDSLEKSSQQALDQLRSVEDTMTEMIRQAEGLKKRSADISMDELRRLLLQVRLQQGLVWQARARLSPPGSQERHSDLLDADELFRKVVSANDNEWRLAAKLGLATGNRLRDELDRAAEMLDAMEKELASVPGESLDALRLERARILLAAGRPDEAAQTLLTMRVGRDRLPGEFWMTYLQTLTALRRTATERKAAHLAAEITQRAEQALNDVDEQVGGPWSRRCRTIWTAAESMQRYGLRMTALISRGKSEYLAGKAEAAITAYASALELAQEDGKTDLEMEVGYTLAAILAQEKRWDEVAQRCRQLVTAHPQHAKSAAIDLLKLHALGMTYDQDRTAGHQSAYEQGLSEHLQNFARSPTLPDVEFLRGQFFETSGNLAAAIDAYAKVPADHARSPIAIAAIARCYVGSVLHARDEDKLDRELEQQASQFLAPQLKTLPEKNSAWSDAQVELAYHAVRAMLLVEPPAFTQADHWLNRLEEALPGDKQTEPTALRAEVGRRVGPLRLIALAGQGRPQEAEQLLGTLEKSSAIEQLAVLEELGQIDIVSPVLARRSLTEMQLATAERLQTRREDLTAPQQRRLDFAWAKSYLATSQPAKAVGVFQQLLTDNPRDRDLARQLGELLALRSETECLALAKSCWQRTEGFYRQGTPEWLDARARLIGCQLRLEEFLEARKLLKVTKLIYGKSFTDELQQRYADLESRMK